MKRNIAIIGLLMGIFMVSNIQLNAQIDSSSLLSEIKVTNGRIVQALDEQGKSITIITAKQIKAMPVQTVAEILNQIAGVDIRQRGANGVQADVALRGGTFDQVLVLIDGIKMSDPQTGHHSLNVPIDVNIIQKIEVIKGAGARVYGQNSYAGVINIITKNPTQDFFNVRTAFGSFSQKELAISAGVVKKKFSNYFAVNNNTSKGYKHNTDYSITNYFYKGKVKLKKNELILSAGLTDKKFGANGFYSSPLFIDQYEETKTSFASVGYNFNVKNKNKINARAYWRNGEDYYLFVRDNPPLFRNHHITNTAEIEANTSIKSKYGVTAFGIDLSKVWISSNNLGDRERYIQTVFVEHKLKMLKDRLTIVPGIQASNYSDFGPVFLPGIDLNLKINKNFALFANAGKTYRVPTYTDLYYVGRTNIGNELLKPEYAFSYEAGLKLINNSAITLQASYFVREGRDVIDWTKKDSLDPWQPTNITELKTSGIDVNAQLKFAKLLKRELFVLNNLTLGYTNINSEVIENSAVQSKYALENLKHQFVANLTMKYHKYINHSVQMRYVDRVNLDSYSVLDSRLGWDNGKLRVYGEVVNILDQLYKETNLVEMPGRWIRVGLGFTFK